MVKQAVRYSENGIEKKMATDLTLSTMCPDTQQNVFASGQFYKKRKTGRTKKLGGCRWENLLWSEQEKIGLEQNKMTTVYCEVWL